jgi:hypothetical protein
VTIPRVRPVPALVLALVWAGTVPDPSQAQTAEPVELRLGARPGGTSEYVHEKRLTLYLPEEMGGTTTTRTTLGLEQRLEAAGRDSVIFETVLAELQFDIDPRPEQLPDLKPLEGLRFRSVATPSGRIYRVELEGISGAVAAPLRDQVESWLRELGFPALPTGPSRPGDSWTDTTRVPLALLLGVQGSAEAVEVRTTRFRELQESDRGPVALLEVMSEWTGAADPQAPGIVVTGSSEQTVRFAIDEGRFVDSRGNSSIRVEIPTGPGAGPVRIDADGSYQTVLLPDGG